MKNNQMTKDTTPLPEGQGSGFVESSLPDNAFRELQPGEAYEPLMSPQRDYSEVNAWSVSWGILMAVIFSAAAAYLGLKVGQVFEAAIPIAIIAVGLSTAAKRKGALGENVIIQSIGASSGVIVAGAIFTLPALYILQAKYPEITVNFFQVFLSSLSIPSPRQRPPLRCSSAGSRAATRHVLSSGLLPSADSMTLSSQLSAGGMRP